MVGSIFSLLGATSTAEGQVDTGKLDEILEELFSKSRENLEQMGRLAVGRAEEGEAYDWLPSNNGSGPVEISSPVAGFFGNGKFLLDTSDGEFNKTIEAAYGQFKTKVVDKVRSSCIQLTVFFAKPLKLHRR